MTPNDQALDQALAALTQLAPITAQLEAEAGGCSIGGGMCFGAGTLLDGRPIEEIACGRRVRTYAPASDHAADERAWDATSLRLFRLDLDYGDGNGVAASLLRPVDWQGAAVGGAARLDLPEMGAVGWARVTAVDPCPPLEEGPGRLVTATFRHRRGVVFDLAVAGEAEPLRATGRHPFWSVDREAWTAAAELRVGERLLAWDGSTPELLARTLRGRMEPVYNIEVEGDHCYRVGEQGLLVHNNSVPCHPCDMATPNQAITLSRGGRSYPAVVDSFMSNGQRQVCRVRRIDGVVLDTTSGDSAMARAAMRATTFGGPPPVYIPSAAQPTNYDAGHLIANRCGGPNEVGNLVPIRTPVNVGGAWAQMEDWIRRCLRQPGVTGVMDVTVTYDESASGVDKYIPTSITVQVLLSTTPTTSRIHTFTIANAPSATFTPPTGCV